jgi:hypothetical protein
MIAAACCPLQDGARHRIRLTGSPAYFEQFTVQFWLMCRECATNSALSNGMKFLPFGRCCFYWGFWQSASLISRLSRCVYGSRCWRSSSRLATRVRGHHLGTIILPEQPANLTWGDADCDTLYMRATTSVYRLRRQAHDFVPYLNPARWRAFFRS